MVDESPPTAGKRFSKDLRRIREERGISVEDIHVETQIAETLIRSFEAGRLYDHSTYNRVYLRSFVQAYADAVNISRETALRGLDAALEGTYEDALAATYLSSGSGGARSQGGDLDSASTPSEADLSVESDEAPTAGGPEGRGGIVGPPRAVGEEPPEESLDPESDPGAPTGAPAPEPDPAPTEEGPEAAPESSEEADAGPTDVEETDAENHETGPEPAASPGDPDGPPDDAERGDATGPEKDTASDVPAWMGEGDEVDSQPDHTPAPASPDPAGDRGGVDTGVVGEPTELGAETTGLSEDRPSVSSPPPQGGPRSPSSLVDWFDTLLSGRSLGVVDWFDDLLAGRSQRIVGWFDDLLSGSFQRIYVTGIGIGFVLLVLVGLGIAYFSAGESGQQAAGPAPPPDTASTPTQTANSGPQSGRSPPADVSLGSTLHLTVLATSNVGALRIQRDDDLRRPYWIREGQADVFPFQEQVTIENELSDVRLFVEGYPYPIQSRDTTGGLEITRSGVEAFVDTLRGTAPPLPVSPDTIPVGTPNP